MDVAVRSLLQKKKKKKTDSNIWVVNTFENDVYLGEFTLTGMSESRRLMYI